MPHHLIEVLRNALVHHGYWALAAVLLLENTGIPVPGETILLLASFLAYSRHELQLPYIILVGTIAATLGDNLGYALGYRGGRPMLERYQRLFRVKPETLARGDQLFARYGPATILFARFVFGMRILAGPLAGVLKMHWRKFFVFNFLGAFLWVSTISSAGYLFGRHWERFSHGLKIFDVVILGIAVVCVVGWFALRKKA